MSAPRIIGIVLVKDEDLFIEQVLTNLIDFCDKIIVTDNLSTDETAGKIQAISQKNDIVEYHRIKKISQSHELIQKYAGKNVWVFGVDGDEIYDPHGLADFREELLAGKYADWWMIFGNVLHCTTFDREQRKVTGHFAPPCRSMTKLYNFGMIESWLGSSGERLHGGEVVFKQGFGEERRCYLYQETPWEKSLFRCLHMCFLKRSSRQKSWKGQYIPRQNPADILSQTRLQLLWSYIRKGLGMPVEGKQEWKIDKFTRGQVHTVDVDQFFGSG